MQILFLSGVIISIGYQNAIAFFRQEPLKGSGLFLAGVFLVLIGWPFFGFIVESVGAFYLFGRFASRIFGNLRLIPFAGPFLGFIQSKLFGSSGSDGANKKTESV